jgi:hypothetical protein
VEVTLAPGTSHRLFFDKSAASALISSVASSSAHSGEAGSSTRVEYGEHTAIPCVNLRAIGRKTDLSHFALQITTAGSSELTFVFDSKDLPNIISILHDLQRKMNSVDPSLS